MIRILYSLFLVLGCTGLPLQAKGDHPADTLVTPSSHAKTATTAATTGKTVKAPSDKTSTTSVAKTSAPVVPAFTANSKINTDHVLATAQPVTSGSKTTALTKTSVKSTVTTSSGPIRIGSSSIASMRNRMGNTNLPSDSDQPAAQGRLARVTAYWPSEGDYYTSHGISSTGIRLHGGHCAVDPRIIPYGSVVEIAGVGKYLAVDTGSAVISREAAREAARTTAEREALVIDLYFESRSDAQQFSNNAPKYASISWYTPTATGSDANAARHLFADENWTKIQNKQL